MQGVTQPVVKDVVLVGAGHAHVAVLRMFGMRPIPGVRFTLISREVHTPYSGMLPGLIAGHYGFDDAHIDTGPLARFAGARLYQDEACRSRSRRPSRDLPPSPAGAVRPAFAQYRLDPEHRGCAGRNRARHPGQADRRVSRAGSRRSWRACSRARGARRLALVGAGAGGVELLLSVERRLRHEVTRAGFDAGALSFVLVSDVVDILPSFPTAFRARFHAILAARGIAVIAGAPVTRVEDGRLALDGHAPVDADEILWTTQAAPARWLAATGLPLDARGFLRVDDTLRVIGRDDVFAAGDTIAFAARELPKSGVYAVRAGPVLADNIRRTLTGRPLRRFRPQRDALYLVSTGEPKAIGTRNGLVFQGGWVWRWKDWIDRRFMAKFNALAGDACGRRRAGLAARRQAGTQGDFRHRHALRRLRRQGRRHRAHPRARRHRAGGTGRCRRRPRRARRRRADRRRRR